jgi:hypothetical protein
LLVSEQTGHANLTRRRIGDPISTLRHGSATAAGCRCRDAVHANLSLLCRQEPRCVVGAGGKIEGIRAVDIVLSLPDIVTRFTSTRAIVSLWYPLSRLTSKVRYWR